MSKSMESEIGFADGTIAHIEKSHDKLRVVVNAWNDKKIEIIFDEVIGFRESLCGEISDVIVSEEKNDFWNWATSRAYEDPSTAIEKYYCFIDNDDSVCLEVLAKSATTLITD